MRQPAIDPAPALRSLIAAIPDDRLREFALEILLVTLTAKVPIARAAPAMATPSVPGKRPRGWSRGRPRGPRKSADKAAI